MAFRRKPPQDNVRRVRTTGKNIRGVITNKTGRTVQYESFNEFKLILILERDPAVLDYIRGAMGAAKGAYKAYAFRSSGCS